MRFIPLVILTLIAVVQIDGKIRFGYGLGDIVYYALNFLALTVYTLYYIFTKDNYKILNRVFPILALIFCIYMILLMTIWRGHESRWNGKIFHSSVRMQKTQNVFDETNRGLLEVL